MQTREVERSDDDASRYGRSFADVYDEWYASAFDTEAALTTLRRLAGVGPVLELGAGTGRLAIPLAASGLDVVALDASAEMLRRLRDNDTDGRVVTVLADMAEPSASPLLRDRRFALVVCACSSILNLPDEASIGRCLSASARLLAPDGVLVIEAIVPAAPDSIPTRSLTPAQVDSRAAVFVETYFDIDTARLHGRHVEVGGGEVRTRPWSVVLLDPVRFDVLADAADLELVARWSDWSGSTFDDDAGSHVSVWRHRP